MSGSGPVVVVFVGPSLRRADLAEVLELAERKGCALDLRPPVRRQDLASLVSGPPPAKVLILDGEFGQSLAVSVTEIRALLFSGFRIAGASSMGALRAVECRTLGMTGSGWVYNGYLDGRLDSDGDVALLYDPDDYAPVTVPLVNVRWVLERAVRAGGLVEADADTALQIARALSFRARRPTALVRAWQRGLPREPARWLEERFDTDRMDETDRKRLDALEAIDAALTDTASGVAGQRRDRPGQDESLGR